MFAKQKKATTVIKAKPTAKAKTVSMKTGIKTPQNKKSKVKEKGGKVKPAPRVDAGYSLYSTDSEDQVLTSYNEMEMCEKILTHLKHKQKGSQAKTRTTGKKDRVEQAASYDPSQVLQNPTLNTDYNGQYQAMLLRRLNHPDYSQTTNPIFNERLTSSTPDPEKLLSDQSQGGQRTGNVNYMMHEPPERDMSSVLMTPNSTHLRNMADMADIYDKLEQFKKEELRTVASQQNHPQSAMQMNFAAGQQAHTLGISRVPLSHTPQQLSQHAPQHAQSADLRSSGSLGFVPVQSSPAITPPTSLTQPVPFSVSGGALPRESGSSIGAFQTYISRDSQDFQPPRDWIKEFSEQEVPSPYPNQAIVHSQPGSNSRLEPQVEPLALSEKQVGTEGGEERLSGRSEKSAGSSGKLSNGTVNTSGTEYVTLPQPTAPHTGSLQSDTQQVRGGVVYKKQNGLYQIHPKIPTAEPEQNPSPPGSPQHSDKSQTPVVSPRQVQFRADVQIQGGVNEAPERDVSTNSSGSRNSGINDGGKTFTLDIQGTQSQTESSTLSTPRNQSSGSSHGNFVIQGQLKTDSFPGISVTSGSQDQPIEGGVRNPMSTIPGSGSVPSSVIGYPVQQEVSGPYHRAVSAEAIAAGDIGVRKLRYLLKELRECNKVSKDSEISRLVQEIDVAVGTIPQLGMTFNLHTEIDLAIQPLRSENSQLRRKLRLINQHLREQEEEKAREPKDINFELLHLQTSNESLQKILKDEKESKTRLAAEIQFLLNEIHKMKVEKSKSIASVSEKDTEQLKLRQESLLQTQQLRHQVDMLKKDVEVTQGQVAALEKENHILQISLQQRDTEIDRQQQIVSTITEALSDLIQELDQSRHDNQAWDHDNSFGLQKLMKIIEVETNVSFMASERSKTTRKKVVSNPEKKMLRFNSTAGSAESSPRLTRAILASHDREHSPREVTLGAAVSDSEVDNTIQEMNRRAHRQTHVRQQPVGQNDKHRRTSSLSPVRLKLGRTDQLRHQRTVSSPLYRLGADQNRGQSSKYVSDRQRQASWRGGGRNEEEEEDYEDREEAPRPAAAAGFRGRAAQNQVRNRPHEKSDANFDALTATSLEQSRYSLTDYFRKYPSSHPISRQEGFMADSGVRFRKGPSFQTSSEADDQMLVSNLNGENRNIKQLTLFRGLHYDQTISAINEDDNVSSVSMNSVSTANTTDERKFRTGIATLDANIAKLQNALQKTKQMLT